VPGEEDRKFSALMTNVGFAEKIVVGGIEKGFVQRSYASQCHYEREQRCKVNLLQQPPSKMHKPAISR